MNNENELTAALLTIEKCRDLTNCPAGVDLQDWVKKLAEENVGLKAAFEQPQAYLSWHAIPPTWNDPLPCGEYLDVHDTDGHKNSDGTDCWPVYAKPEIETPATNRIVAGIKADGAKAAGDYLKMNAQHMSDDERLRMQDAAEICYGTAARLREGADK